MAKRNNAMSFHTLAWATLICCMGLFGAIVDCSGYATVPTIWRFTCDKLFFGHTTENRWVEVDPCMHGHNRSWFIPPRISPWRRDLARPLFIGFVRRHQTKPKKSGPHFKVLPCIKGDKLIESIYHVFYYWVRITASGIWDILVSSTVSSLTLQFQHLMPLVVS